jgi:tripartite-type tricarboxylate transporter receptor subunit TctC
MNLLSSLTRIVALGLSLLTLGAQAQDVYPSKTIKIIVPIAAGGATDVQARAMADELQKRLKVAVVVENKPGGNFVIGNVAVATAPPDGYTVGWALSAAMSLNPLLYKNLPYKPGDFQFLAPVSKGHHVIAVPSSAKPNSLKEWIAEIKRSDQPAAIGVSSTGGTTHLMAETVGERAGFAVQPIVYRGEAPAVLDLVAGQLPAMSGIVASVLDHYKAGKVKVLAISSEKRIPELPEVPTFKELGYDFVVTYWNGMVAPAGTPKPIVDKLSTAIREVVASPEFKTRISAAVPDMHIISGSPQLMGDMIKEDTVFWSRIITSRNIKIDN